MYLPPEIWPTTRATDSTSCFPKPGPNFPRISSLFFDIWNWFRMNCALAYILLIMGLPQILTIKSARNQSTFPKDSRPSPLRSLRTPGNFCRSPNRASSTSKNPLLKQKIGTLPARQSRLRDGGKCCVHKNYDRPAGYSIKWPRSWKPRPKPTSSAL